jgi:tetratricopeptide (TPR) repeat protein
VVQYGEMANGATSRAPADKRAEILRITGDAYLTIASASDPNTRAINTAKAIEFNEAALKLKPNDPGFMNDLGYSYAEHYDLSMPGASKLQDALRLTRTAVTQARNEGVSERDLGMYVDSLGWVYYKLQDYDQAVANLARAADLAPGVKEIHLHLAQALHAKGRTDDALVELEKALRIDPGYHVAVEQLQKWKGSAPPGQGKSSAPPAIKSPPGPSQASDGRRGPVTQTVGPSPLLRPRP